MMKRCKECTLLRVEREGETCEECIRNGAVVDYTVTFSQTPTFVIDYSKQTTDWYDAVNGCIP